MNVGASSSREISYRGWKMLPKEVFLIELRFQTPGFSLLASGQEDDYVVNHLIVGLCFHLSTRYWKNWAIPPA